FLVSDARRVDTPDLERYFKVRALAAGLFAGAVAFAGIFVLRDDAHYLFEGLVHDGLPLVIISALSGLGVLLLLRRGATRGARPLGAQGACAARGSPTRRAAARAWASTLSGSDGAGQRLVEDLIRPAASPLLLLISHASSNGGVRLRARVAMRTAPTSPVFLARRG